METTTEKKRRGSTAHKRNITPAFLSGRKALSEYLDCGLARTQELIDDGLPKLSDGRAWVFRTDVAVEFYQAWLEKKYPVQEIKLKF